MKIIRTRTAEIWIDSEKILHLKVRAGATINLQEVKTHFSIYRELGCENQKALHLFEGKDFFQMNEEAMKYVVKHGSDFFIASAIVSNSGAIKLHVNLFNSFFNTSLPFKLFHAKTEALKWLRTFKEK